MYNLLAIERLCDGKMLKLDAMDLEEGIACVQNRYLRTVMAPEG